MTSKLTFFKIIVYKTFARIVSKLLKKIKKNKSTYNMIKGIKNGFKTYK